MKSRDATLVYSSGPAGSSGPKEPAAQPQSAATEQRHPIVRVGIDKKRRRGKSVTVAIGFQLKAEELAALARELKKRSGAGGTARENEIEIQGEHVELVKAELEKRGFRVK